MKNKIILLILDGFALRKCPYGSGTRKKDMPFTYSLLKKYPYSKLKTHGKYVGLPNKQMGNSEVGHLNIGSGRVVKQNLLLINEKIEKKEFENKKEFSSIKKHLEKFDTTLHLSILLSDGGVHSHINHLFKTIDIFKNYKVDLHLILDGRDTPQTSSFKYLAKLNKKIKSLSNVNIGSISGRYYAMDRDKNLVRTNLAFDEMFLKNKTYFKDPFLYINNEYKRMVKEGFEKSDEFVKPAYFSKSKKIKKDDTFIFLNFRPDRFIQLSLALQNHFKEEKLLFFTMLPYRKDIKAKSLFNQPLINNTLGEVLANRGYKQLRISESEKYAHVTYFFDGMKKYDGKEKKELTNCKQILVSSLKVDTYDKEPKMSLFNIKDELIKELKKEEKDFVVANFANLDMVGHSGILKSIRKAAFFIDVAIKEVYDFAKKNNYLLLVTSDHGNAEKAHDLLKRPYSAHTKKNVPFLICSNKFKLKKGKLANIAPTILQLGDEEKPNEINEESLLKKGG